jgi:hypothetical protein
LSLLVLIAGGLPRSAASGTKPGSVDVVPTLGFRASVPNGASASISLSFDRVPEAPQFCTHEVLGPSVQVEAGSGGGHLGLGVALLCRDSSWFPKVGGLALRGVYSRTWGKPWRAEPGRSYVGGYLDAYLSRVTARVGLLKRVGGSAGAEETLVAFGVGVGF